MLLNNEPNFDDEDEDEDENDSTFRVAPTLSIFFNPSILILKRAYA